MDKQISLSPYTGVIPVSYIANSLHLAIGVSSIISKGFTAFTKQFSVSLTNGNTGSSIYSDGDLEIFLHDDGEIIFSNTASRLNEVQVGKLFDRFFTVEAARNANGLGLAISKALIEQMGGSISAELVNKKLIIHIRFQ